MKARVRRRLVNKRTAKYLRQTRLGRTLAKTLWEFGNRPGAIRRYLERTGWSVGKSLNVPGILADITGCSQYQSLVYLDDLAVFKRDIPNESEKAQGEVG